MLNLLQHYQKYNYKVPDSNRTKQSSCDVNSDKYPKYRICSQCTHVSPGNQGIPSSENNLPDKQIQKQKQNNNLWIGVL